MVFSQDGRNNSVWWLSRYYILLYISDILILSVSGSLWHVLSETVIRCSIILKNNLGAIFDVIFPPNISNLKNKKHRMFQNDKFYIDVTFQVTCFKT